MAHAVETMMFAGEVPWHGLGVYVGGEPISAADAIRKAGLDWTVERWNLIARPAGEIPSDSALEAYSDEDRVLVRTSDRKVLGVCSDRYQPIQNREAFDFMDAVAGPGRLVSYHTAGSLHGGKKIWMLAELQDLRIEPVDGDVTTPYLLLTNEHTAKGSLRAFFTTVRVVCQNTLNLALRGAGGEGVSVSHLGDIKGKVAEAQRVLGLARRAVEGYGEVAERLVSQAMDDAAFRIFLEALVPLPADALPHRAESIRSSIMNRWNEGPGTDIVGVEGTAWNALQAVTGYTSHDRTTYRTQGGTKAVEQRLASTWFGTGNALNKRAMGLLLEGV